mgnify:CR=1 FL=1
MSDRVIVILTALLGFGLPFVAAELLRVLNPAWDYLTLDFIREFDWKPYFPILQLGLFFNVVPLLIFNALKSDAAIKGLIAGTLCTGAVLFGLWLS